MLERHVTVTNQLGLHARAAARLVNTANSCRSTITLEKVDGGSGADAKSIMSVLLLAASMGTRLRVTTSGEDESEALDAVCLLIENGFGESEGNSATHDR